ncbi:MAG: hypothetical protein ABR541_05530 [Candidatus Dormibacteria bacterium]
MRRSARATETAAETLELVAGLPLLAMVTALILQGVVLERQQVQAESDARQVVRAAAVCGPVLSAVDRLRAVDPSAVDRGATVRLDRLGDTGLTRATVTLVPEAVVAGLSLGLDGLRPHASVVMHDEPC